MAYMKPKDYDSVKVGEMRILPAGGYVCKILKAEETTSKTGKAMLKIAFDIDEGEFKWYFRNLFDGWKDGADDPKSVKWPFGGTKWILFLNSEGKTNRDFKSFCTALEDSGAVVWNNNMLNTAGLRDAHIGIIFRREEHEYNNARSWRTVPIGFRSVSTIEEGNYTVPEDKPLPPQDNSWTEVDSFEALDEDLPF